MPVVELTIDSSGAVTGMKQYDKAVDDSAKKTTTAFSTISKSVKTLGAGVAAGATALAAGIGAATTGIAAYSAALVQAGTKAREIENLARLAKVGAEEFQNLSGVTERYGVTAEHLADITKDVQDKLGDFVATGAGPFKDFFEQVAPLVGITADELAKMSGPDALIAVKDAMDKANISAAEQVFYLESIGNDLTLLNPLLENSGELWKQGAERAELLGTALSDIDIQNLKEGTESVNEIIKLTVSLKDKVIADLAPEFKKMTDALIQGFIDSGTSVDDLAGKISGGLMSAINGAVSRTQEWYALWERMGNQADKWSLQSKINDLREELGHANEALELAENGFLNMGKAADSEILRAQQRVDQLEQAIKTLEQTGSTALDGFVSDVGDSIENFGKVEGAVDDVTGAVEDLGKETEAYRQTAEGVWTNIKGEVEDLSKETEAYKKTAEGVWTNVEGKVGQAAEGVKEYGNALSLAGDNTVKFEQDSKGVFRMVATEAEEAAFDVKALALQKALAAKKAEEAEEAEKKLAESLKEVAKEAKEANKELENQAGAVDKVKESVDRLDVQGSSEDGYSAGSSGAGGSTSGTYSAHGDALSDEQWQALPQWQQDLLVTKRNEGYSDYDYFSKSTGNRFQGGQGYNAEWAAFTATAMTQMNERFSDPGSNGVNITNNFNQSISRSDVTSITEEQARTGSRT